MKKVIIGILSTIIIVLVVLTISLTIKHNKLVTDSGTQSTQSNSVASNLPEADSPNTGVNVDLTYLYTEQEVMDAIDGLEIEDLYDQKKILFDGSRAFIESGVNKYYREYYITKDDGVYNLNVDGCVYEIAQSKNGLTVDCRGSIYIVEVN